MTTQLNKELHTLLSGTGLNAQKADLVFAFTGRSESSKDMTDAEAKQMIDWLRSKQEKPDDAANRMRRKIISLAYEMHWAKAGDWKAAIAAIDAFCTGPKSLFKKTLNKHSYNELVQVVSQFEMMYKKYLNKF